jgi:K(+)-stimulated pyrophosphate-energized sodium pump
MAIAVFGLFQAMYMANAGGSWDNAKKLVEVDFGEKNTPVHAATVIGDTVGDPFKDTTSVSLNPIIKFSTLFGMLAVEIAIKMNPSTTRICGVAFFLMGLFFVWKSFYKMRIPAKSNVHQENLQAAGKA